MGVIDWFLNKLIPDATAPKTVGSHNRSNQLAAAATPTGSRLATLVGEADPDQCAANDIPWWTPEGVTRLEPNDPPMPAQSTDARALENTLVEHFDGHDLAMPPLPSVTERVLARLSDGRSSLREVAREIADDQVVAAEIIRMANCVLYRGLHQATTLQAAVTRLGTKAVRTCVLNQSMRAAMFGRKGTDNELAALVWYQSLAGSQIMRSLATLLNMDEEEASLLGLMHDIGNVIVLRFVEEFQKLAHRPIDAQTFDYLCHEAHQEFGELVAESWKMPNTLKAIVSSHHTYPEENDPLRKERLMIILSDMIAAMLGYAPPAQYALLQSRVVRDLGLDTRPAFEPFLHKLEARVEEAVGALGIVPGSPIANEGEYVPGVITTWLKQLRQMRQPE